MSIYLIRIVFSLTFKLQHNISLYIAFYKQLPRLKSYPGFLKILEISGLFYVMQRFFKLEYGSRSTLIFIHGSFTLNADLSAAHGALFCLVSA